MTFWCESFPLKFQSKQELSLSMYANQALAWVLFELTVQLLKSFYYLLNDLILGSELFGKSDFSIGVHCKQARANCSMGPRLEEDCKDDKDFVSVLNLGY